MLARISEGIASAVGLVTGGDAQRAFLAEFKYDGMRAQCHLLPGGEVRVFSRNCEDRTPGSSDVVLQLLEAAQGGERRQRRQRLQSLAQSLWLKAASS